MSKLCLPTWQEQLLHCAVEAHDVERRESRVARTVPTLPRVPATYQTSPKHMLVWQITKQTYAGQCNPATFAC
jgi:hypothetical protein